MAGSYTTYSSTGVNDRPQLLFLGFFSIKGILSDVNYFEYGFWIFRPGPLINNTINMKNPVNIPNTSHKCACTFSSTRLKTYLSY
jgi:hypothetical protein